MTKFKHLNDKDSWLLAEHFPNIDFFFSQIWLSSFVNNLENSCGKNYKKILCVFNPKFYIHFYYDEKDSLDFEQHLIKMMKDNTEFGFSINKNIIKRSDKLKIFSKKLGQIKLEKITNKKLWGLLEEQDDIHTKLYEWGWLSNATDMFHASFTTELKDYLEKQLFLYGKDQEINRVFNVLTTPHEKSIAAEEEENLLKIAVVLKNHKEKKEKTKEMINEHHAKYFYLKYLWIGNNGLYKKDYYLKLATELSKDKIPPKKKLLMISKDLIETKKEKQKLFKKLKISKKYKDLFSIYSDFMLTKLYRRYAQIFWSYQVDKLLKETSKRLNLTLDEVRYMLPREIREGLLKNRMDRKEIKKRLSFCFYYAEKNKDLLSTNKNHKVLNQLKVSKQKNVKELTGQVGCLGKARGIVRIINSEEEMAKMKSGDILVSIATNPDLVPVMKKAAAIITEQGGVTCHAAIVSRELKKPCVIGTKIATKVLKDGDLVEVDANKGIIKILKRKK